MRYRVTNSPKVPAIVAVLRGLPSTELLKHFEIARANSEDDEYIRSIYEFEGAAVELMEDYPWVWLDFVKRLANNEIGELASGWYEFFLEPLWKVLPDEVDDFLIDVALHNEDPAKRCRAFELLNRFTMPHVKIERSSESAQRIEALLDQPWQLLYW